MMTLKKLPWDVRLATYAVVFLVVMNLFFLSPAYGLGALVIAYAFSPHVRNWRP